MALTGLFTFFGVATSFIHATPINPNNLEFEPKLISFGVVGHSMVKTAKFKLHNLSDRPLEISKFKASCSCITTTLPNRTIPAQSYVEGQISVNFGRGFGRFRKHVDFFLKTHKSPAVLDVRAQFHPGIKVSDRS